MSARTLVLPTVLGLALMACGNGGETTAPVLPLAHPITRDSVPSPSIDVTPRTATLVRGARLSLFVALKGFNDDGSNQSPIWTSSNSTVVQVSRLIVNGSSYSIPSAVAYAAGAGSATITVWVAGQSASVEVTVIDNRQ
jgi:uncharacterized protein YjdB